MRKHGKTDANQAEIVQELRDGGMDVMIMSSLGEGRPEILTGYCGQTYGPYEVKKRGGKLTPAEFDWWRNWHGSGKIIYCSDDVWDDVRVRIGKA